MEIENKLLQNILQSVSHEARSWFSFRCALRELPNLMASQKNSDLIDFWYWKESDRRKHLISLFVAIDQSASYNYKLSRYSLATAAAAYAAYTASSGSLPAANAAYTAADAAYATAFSSSSSGAVTSVFSSGTYSLQKQSGQTILSDLSLMRSGLLNWSTSLWLDVIPEHFIARKTRLISALHKIGLSYWAHEYDCWTRGEFNLQRRLRRQQITPELIAAGPDAVMAFLEGEETARLAEARVIFIGDGGVGKTSIIRRLHGEPLQPSEAPTPGVFVREKDEHVGAKAIHVHYWDFGGQVFLHGTHQLFLRERCVNVIVLKARETGEREMAEYWLEHVRVFGGGSPTIIVQNQVDALEKGMQTEFPFDADDLRRQYPFIKACLNLSCKTDEGLAQLREAVEAALADPKISNHSTTPEWFALKESLRQELPHSAHIDSTRFQQLCEAAGIANDAQETALSVMDQLGIALHFKGVDPCWYILDPSWLTSTIYYLLWSAKEHDMHGTLSVEMLRLIFDKKRHPDAPEVPADKHTSLLKLLVSIGIAFEYLPGQFRVPMLAPENAPTDLVLPSSEATGFVVKMDTLLPSLVFHRYVAQCGAEIVGERMWRSGCLLSHGGATALVKMTRLKREISIVVWGQSDERGRYQTILRERLQKLLGEDMAYRNLEYVPSFEMSGRTYEWRGALRAFLEGNPKLSDMQGGSASIVDVMQAAFGLGQLSQEPIIDELRRMSLSLSQAVQTMAERSAPVIHIEASPHINVSPTISAENNNNLTLIANLKTLVKIKSVVEELDYDLDRLKLYGEEYYEVRNDIAEIRKLIEAYQANKDTGEIADTERESLLERVKRMGQRVIQAVSSVDNLTSIANNINQLLQAL